MRKSLALILAILSASPVWAGSSASILIQSHTTGSGGGGGSSDPASTDTFTAGSNEDLGVHTADTGEAWSDRDSTSNGDINATTDVLFPSAQGGGGGWAYTIAETPTDANYCASLSIFVGSSGKGSIGPAIRVAAGASGDYITARHEGTSTIRVYERTGGSTNAVGSGWAVTSPTSVPVPLKICGSGTTLSVYFNGSLLGTETVTTTATGSPGIAGYFPDSGEANTYADSFRVDNDLP